MGLNSEITAESRTTQTEWRKPILRRLVISATAGGTEKGQFVDSNDGVGGGKGDVSFRPPS